MCNMCARTTDPEVLIAPVVPPKTTTNKTIEKYKRKHNIQTDPTDVQKQKEVEYQPDLLAVSTQYTKLIFKLVKRGITYMQDTKAYVVATKTTQPFHVALAVLVFVAWMSRPGGSGNVRGWTALYVVAVATHLGSQIWMTLVSGIVLYFALPRHEFGRVQTVLFPVYYAFNAGVSLLAVLAYFRTQYLTGFRNTSWIQLALLLAVFAIEASVRIRLVKPMLRAKHIKTQMEETAGNGQEIGKLVLGELAHCPRYLRVLKTFRSYHSTIVIGTILTLGCSLYSTMFIVDGIC